MKRRSRKRRNPADEFNEQRLGKIAHLKLRHPLSFHAIWEGMLMNGELEVGAKKEGPPPLSKVGPSKRKKGTSDSARKEHNCYQIKALVMNKREEGAKSRRTDFPHKKSALLQQMRH